MRLLLILAFVVTAAPAFADAKTDAMVTYLKSLHEDPKFEATLRTRGFSGQKLWLSRKFTETLFKNDKIAHYAARRFLRWEMTSNVDDIDIINALFPLIDDGLPHINANDMALIMRLRFQTLRAMPEQTCGRLVSGNKVNFDFDGTHAQLVAGLREIDLKRLYEAYHDAVLKGLQKRGPPALGQQRKAEAGAEIRRLVMARIAKRSDAATLSKALDEIDRAGPVVSCRLVLIFMDSVLAVQGRNKRIALQMFLSD